MVFLMKNKFIILLLIFIIFKYGRIKNIEHTKNTDRILQNFVLPHSARKITESKSSYLSDYDKIIIFKQIKSNISRIKSQIRNTKFGFVLKQSYAIIRYLNNKYGINTQSELAKYIENDVDVYFVANIQEGVNLRKYNIKKPIMILYLIDPDEVVLAEEYDLEILIPSIDYFNLSKNLIKKNIKVHLWYDMGLGKEGNTNISELLNLYNYLKASNKIKIIGLGTKYNTSDPSYGLKLNKYNEIPKDIIQQHNEFKKIIKLINDPNLLIHTACTFEVQRNFTDSYFDIVRIGKLAYRNISWTQKILDIKNKKSTDCFGYYCKYTKNKDNKTKPYNIKIAFLKNLANIRNPPMEFFKIYTLDGIELSLILNEYDPFGIIIPNGVNLNIGSKILIKYNDLYAYK